MKRHFCTLFDRNYLCRGLALHESLRRHCPDFVLHVLCMDALSFALLDRLALPSVELIALHELEDVDLLRVKPSRSPGEYCWTCTPSLPLHVLESTPGIHQVTYLDADLFFFSSPEAVFAEAGDASITVHEHRFSDQWASLTGALGRFNVGWVGFRGDAQGLACLRRWREQCLDWCHARQEPGRFGDQKYLDEWPARYDRLHVIRNVGAGFAPWNLDRYRVSAPGGRVQIDDDALVFVHFHGFALYTDLTSKYADEQYRIEGEVLRLIYTPYERALQDAQRRVQAISPGFSQGLLRKPPPTWRDRARRALGRVAAPGRRFAGWLRC